jgi:hypothetical protein
VRAHRGHALAALVVLAVALRVVLVVRSPTPYGYVFDFYHEGVQKLYALGRLPIASDCWQCYHPPFFYVIGLPFYALGKKLLGGPTGLADPALRVLAMLSLICAGVTAYYGDRLLRFYRVGGLERIIGLGLILAFPCLFIASYGIEADIVLTAIMTAFIYYAASFGRRSTWVAAVRLGALAGLACATKYSGLLAPTILLVLAGVRVFGGPRRPQTAGLTAVALVVCVLVGGWKYVDNVKRYGAPLFANGSAQQGFALEGRPNFASQYDFLSLRMRDLVALERGWIPPGHLTDLPFYRSVWTTLHAMAWGDMSLFSDPSRHGFFREPYPRKKIAPWLAIAVLCLGLVPNVLAIVGAAATATRRTLRPIMVSCLLAWAAYIAWFIAQESWALKTKYILFLLPAYVLYALFGWRWVSRHSATAGHVVLVLLVLLLVLTNLYLLDFAWS